MNFTGKFPSSKFCRYFPITLGKMLQPEARSDNDIELPYLRAASVAWGAITDEFKNMWFSRQDLGQYRVSSGDLVVIEGGDVGRAAIVPEHLDGIGFQNSIHRVQPSKVGSVRFALYWLQHLKVSGYFDLVCSKATLAHFTLDKFKVAPFPRIELSTQKVIADFLDRETARIDQLIDKKRRLVDLLQEKLENDVFRLLTRGSDGDAKLISEPELEWISERPAHWRNYRLKHFFRENTRYSLNGSEVLFSLRMNEGLVPHNDVSDKEILPADLIGYKKISPGQIVMNRMRAAIGLFGLADAEGIVSPDYSVFDVSPEAHPGYFLRLFKTSPMMTAFRILSKGLGTGHSGFMRLNADRFGGIRVAVPDFEEQRIISVLVENRINQICKIQGHTKLSADRLCELRSALITAAVTGQIDVTNWGKRGNTDRRLDAIEEEMTQQGARA